MTPHWLTALPIAHRGLHGAGAPENSRAAFAAAAAAGYAIELDVQLSADGVPMVFHDDTLDRLTTARGPVAAWRAADLTALGLAGGGETIPTLAAVVGLVGGRVPLLVELKAGGRPGRLETGVAEILRRPGLACAVQSFNPMTVNWFRRFAPTLTRGQIAMDWRLDDDTPRPDRLLLAQMVFNRISRPDFVAYDVRALPCPATERARAQGLPLLAWTVRSAADLRRAARYADNVIFEDLRP